MAKEADWTTPVQLEDSDIWVMGSEAVPRGGCVITSEMDIPVDLIEGSVLRVSWLWSNAAARFRVHRRECW